MKIETIETERLYLRGFEKEDADFAISIWNDPEMGEYLGDPTLDHVDEAYRKSIEALGENKTCCYLISESKAGKERIGTCSFIPRQDGKVYDIAYCVHKKYWRNGYATEMVRGMGPKKSQSPSIRQTPPPMRWCGNWDLPWPVRIPTGSGERTGFRRSTGMN